MCGCVPCCVVCLALGCGLDVFGVECGPGSVVGVATGYGLDGLGVECGPGSVVGVATGYGLDGPGIECGPGSLVGVATGYGLDGPGIESRWKARFSALVQTCPGAHPASCTRGTGSFPGVKRPGSDADPSPPSSAVVMKG
jgi:hypothetical protein